MGRQNQSDPNFRVLYIHPPNTYYQDIKVGSYSIVSDAYKYAAISTAFAISGNWGLVTVNLLELISTVDFENGNYQNNYAELSWATESVSGWLYSKYFTGIKIHFSRVGQCYGENTGKTNTVIHRY